MKNTRIWAMMIALCMLLSISPAFAASSFEYGTNNVYDEGLVDYDSDPIVINVYSQLANFNGEQLGWSAALMLDLFNVKINIIQDQDGVFATRMADGNLGDLVVWGSNGADYKTAVERGMLLDLEKYDMLEEYAPYIAEHYTNALENNRNINSDGKVHGFGHGIALASEGAAAHQSFFYTWDLRWDLYKELGYPEVKNMDDMLEVFKQMKAICPTDENGNETYAASLWPDWDGSMVMYVKSLGTAYYGYDELGIGHYNPENGEFYDCLADGSPYMEMLKWFNKLYQAGLLDPNSGTQTYEKMSEKVKASGTFWSIFNYAGSMAYNTDDHMAAGKYMYACVPSEARPIVYGMSDLGGNRIWSVGASTEYPELCLAILDFIASPEGSMTMWYGPRGLMWDYNEEGGMYFTELGKACNNDSQYDLAGKEWTSIYTGKTYPLSGSFNDGCLQINNVTLSRDMINPDGELGETFFNTTWVSENTAVTYDIQQDWRDHTGYTLADQYMENTTNYVIKPETTHSESSKDTQLTLTWKNVTNTIVTYTWRAIMAKNDGEFNFHVQTMRNLANQYGYADCVAWSQGEADAIWALQQAGN